VAIAAGAGHSLALKNDGRIVGWGNNVYGQCNFSANLTNVIAVSGGALHSLALLGALPSVPSPMYPIRSESQFSIVVQTAFGKHYTLEYKDSLGSASWSSASTILGQGSLQFLIDLNATPPQRFYRIRQW
jgi:hypothetical protein